MIFQPLLAASVFSLAASALVVPSFPTTSDEADIAEDHHLPILDRIAAERHDSELVCSRCPFPEAREDGLVNWVEGIETVLVFNVTTKNGFLYVNDHQVFPPPDSTSPLTVVQRRISDGQLSAPVRMALLMDVSPLMPPEDGNELLAIRFTVPLIEDRPVLVETITLNTIRTTTSNFLITGVEVELPAATDDLEPLNQSGSHPPCLKDVILSRIQSLWASARTRLTDFSSHLHSGKGCRKGASAGHMPGHRKAGHHYHAHDSHHHQLWRHTFSRAVRFIIIPALLGVMAGLAASAIGMLVGQLVVFFWLRYRSSPSNRSSCVSGTVEEGTCVEKEVLLASESTETLPPYSDEDAANAPQVPDVK